MVKSGLNYSFGMGFWGPNGHDAIWHLSLASNLSKGSFDMPIFAGERLKNYHIGYDLLLALTHKLTGLSLVTLNFQVFPILLSTGIGFLTYKFVMLWKNSKKVALWSVYFVYFGGSFGWIINIIRGQEIGGESMFWSQQAVSTLINPPFALSILLMLAGLIYLIKFQKFHTANYLLLAATVFGVLIEIKSYAGILTLISLFIVSIFQVLKEKKLNYLLIFAGSLIISILLFLPLNRGSAGLIVWRPFWFLETMMILSDRFYWPKFYDAMTTYRASRSWTKMVSTYFLALVIFWIGNMGTRIMKELEIFKWIRNYKKNTFIEIFLISIIIFGVAIPMFFLQKGTPWNTIQFFYYSLFFSAILAGVAVSRIVNYLLLTTIVLLTFPTTIATLAHHYLPTRPPAKLSNYELEALNFLSKEPDGVVLTYPFDKNKADEAVTNPPRPLYLYDSTAYVSAFSGKPVYLEDEVNLDITGFNWKDRRMKVEKFLNSLDQKEVRDFLRENKIEYIYWLKGQRAKFGEDQLGLTRIFENKEVDIYKVKS